MVIISNTGLFQKSTDGSKIGLMLKKPESNFSNGCVQQAIFLKQMLEKAGYVCEYLSIEPKFTKIDDLDQKVRVLHDFMQIPEYKVLIFVSLNLVSPENDKFITMIKRSGAKCVNLICGNVFILHQEEFIFNTHHILSKFKNDFYDEYWVLEMYPFAVEYIRLMTDKPTHLLPYVWNNTILQSYISKNKVNIEIDYHSVNRDKINIVIFEPNMSIHKTSLIPLLICERYHTTYPGLLNKVFVFCGDKVIKLQNGDFIRGLSIYKDRILEAYPRMIMPSVFSFIRKHNTYLNVVISHNIMNELNFLHLELLSLDIPIIHNCAPFKENGLYYDDFTTCNAIEHIEKVRTNFYVNSDYVTGRFNILKKFHPDQTDRQEAWISQVYRLSGLKPTNVALVDKDESKELIQLLIKMANFIKKQVKIDNTLFYNGIGVVSLVQDINELPLLELTINSLIRLNNTLNVEIIYSTEKIEKKQLLDKLPPQTSFKLDLIPMETIKNDSPNEFNSCVFSTFEQGIFATPGTVFVDIPMQLINEYLTETTNSFRYYPSFKKIKHMEQLEQDIQKKLTLQLSKHELNDNDFMSDNSILFFNKSDKNCSKVLGTLCEMSKLHPTVVINSNIMKLVCELNYENTQSRIDTKQSLVGIVKDGFKGFGIKYDNIMICLNKMDNEDDTSYLHIDIEENNVNLAITENKELSFEGKCNAKKLPKLFKNALL
jgi:hypothetical protein